MFDKKNFSVVLPQPIKCSCGTGMLVPIIAPVLIKLQGPQIGLIGWGDMYQVFWKCTECNKKIMIDGE